MDIKIFSAQHTIAKTGSLQAIEKIKRPDFNEEAWIFAGFQSDNGVLKNIYEKICAVFEEAYFKKDEEGDDFDRLEEALKVVNEVIKEDVKELDESIWKDGGFLIAIFSGNNLYFTSCGTPEVYFVRKGRFTVISEGLTEQGKVTELFTNVANGELKDDDKIIFTSSRLLRHVTGNQIAEALQSGVTESMEAMKFILVDDEPINLVIFHIKTLSKLPFEGGSKSKGEGFFKKATSKSASSLGAKMPSGVKNFWNKIASSNWHHKNAAIIFAVLIGLVLVAIFFGLLSQQKNDEQKEVYRTEIQTIKEDLSSAEARYLEGKITEANNLLDRVETTAKEINEQGYFRQEVMAILEETQNKRNEINGITRLSGAKVVVDLASSRDNVDLRGVFELNSEIYAYDNNVLFQILGGSGEVKNIYNLKESESVIDGTIFDAKSEMIFLTNDGKIIEFKDEEGSYASTTDESFKKAIAVKTFSKYMYLLSPEDNEIWKYERQDNGFTEAQDYNSDADLSKAISFSIDGSIYALTSEGDVIKAHRAKQVDYAIKDAPDGNLKGSTKVYTNDKLNKLYFLNPAEKSILIFSKGQNEAYYQRQVVIEDIEEIRDFWVDPATERLVLVDNSKVYEVKL